MILINVVKKDFFHYCILTNIRGLASRHVLENWMLRKLYEHDSITSLRVPNMPRLLIALEKATRLALDLITPQKTYIVKFLIYQKNKNCSYWEYKIYEYHVHGRWSVFVDL